MSEEMMNTKEVARYLGIHEKQVYALIKVEENPFHPDHREVGLSKEADRRMDRIERQKGLEKAREKSKRMERGAAGLRQQ